MSEVKYSICIHIRIYIYIMYISRHSDDWKKKKFSARSRSRQTKKQHFPGKHKFSSKVLHTQRCSSKKQETGGSKHRAQKKTKQCAVSKIHTHTTTQNCCLASYVARLARKMWYYHATQTWAQNKMIKLTCYELAQKKHSPEPCAYCYSYPGSYWG